MKSGDYHVKKTQVMPEEDKITVTDVTSTGDVKNAVNTGEKEVKVVGMDKVSMFIDRALAEDKRKLEWHVAVNIIDNFFFVLFIVTILISSLVILIQPKVEAES